MSVLRWKNGECGFDKMHIVSLYLRRPADTLCDHIYPHMGRGLVM